MQNDMCTRCRALIGAHQFTDGAAICPTPKTKTTHTPGPWSIEVVLDDVDQIERKVIAVEKGRKHITAICTWGGSPDPEADANARLIAMAPRMVEFIRKLAGHVSEDYADGREARAILRELDG